MLMHRQLLKDRNAWGHDAADFNPRRFLKDESLLRSKSYTPFGGGVMLCPGRFMARAGTMVFLALLIQRYEITTTGPLPRVDTNSGTGLGILGVRRGDDSVLLLSQKKV